ncbi:DUF3889 domain-containing protein [Neobacillus sp. D3-1R]|uniref:DUF3889 domain-containing protein n=1 Tax=Neobacillus sp. D3-1R TaxID=3445778 RepID=UPI003F9F3FB0
MKIVISILLVFFFFFPVYRATPHSSNIVFAEPDIPTYAKWGKIAMQKTKERYPKADIIDYLHVGREKGSKTSTEKFKLWLKEGSKEYGVYIDIQFDNKTEKITNIKYKKTTK